MVRKLLSVTAIVALAFASFAVLPRINKAEMVEKVANVPVPQKQMLAEESQTLPYDVPDPGLLKPSVRQSSALVAQPLAVAKDARDFVSGLDTIRAIAKSGLNLVSQAPKKVRRAEGAAPKVKTGVFYENEVNYNGLYYTSRMTLNSTETAGVYTVTNVYNMTDTINVNINETTGEVSIPQQVLFTHSTYGDVSIIPIDIRQDGFYLVSGDLKGVLSSDGTITLGTWAVAVTSNNEYRGSLFNIFAKSEWMPANGKVEAFNPKDGETLNNEILIASVSENEVLLCGLTGIPTTDALLCRLTADKRMLISPQTIYTNMLYGAFCNYPCKYTVNQETQQINYSVDSKTCMVFEDKGNKELYCGGYVISAKSSPSLTIGYFFKDVKLTLDEAMVYPAPIPMNMEGAGTAEAPYLIKNISDIKAISQASEGGNTFAGVNFALANDVDMSPITPTSWTPIGSEATPFEGKLDGKGYTVSNFYADGKGFSTTGFFGYLGENSKVSNINFHNARVTSSGLDLGIVAGYSKGVISDISIKSSVVDCNGELGGGIVGETSEAVIENCYFSGAVYSCGSAAGICAESLGGVIRNCHVDANIILDGALSAVYNKECAGIVGTAIRNCKISNCYVSGVLEDQKGFGYMGGIAAYLSGCEVNECFNTAFISAKRTDMGTSQYPDQGDNHCGGLVGYCSDSKLLNSYNAGTIVKSEPAKFVGGLVAYLGVSYISSGSTPTQMGNVCHIENCYNSGQILSYYDYGYKGVYGGSFTSTSYTGPGPEDMCIKNCYADSQMLGLEYEKFNRPTRTMVAALPEGFDSAIWEITPGSYPVLKNTGAGTQAQELSSKPLTLRANDNSNKVKVEFEVAPSTNVAWQLSHDASAGESATETKALRMEGSKVYVKDQYANSVVVASSANSWGMKLYRLAVVPKLFDGEGTAEDPYLMKTVADYKNLHAAVAVYGQEHIGDYFAMANDIDFAKTEEFSGIGFGSSNRFRGSFDGKGKYVHNLKINGVVVDEAGEALPSKSYAFTGFFGGLGEGGKVCNVNIADDCDFLHYTYGGAVAGTNLGTIENCRNYADVKGITSYIGGIAGINAVGGQIIRCYNAGEVSTGTGNAGGITGYGRETSSVTECQNDGVVINKYHNTYNQKAKSNTFGGIIGYNYGVVDKCVNTADVTAYNAVGGIAGASSSYYGEGSVSNSLNTGLVTTLETTVDRGGIVGKISGTCTYANNAYDASINVNGAVSNSGNPGAKAYYTSELVAGTALEGFETDIFDYKANAYPVLKQFASEDAAKNKRVMYAAFAKNQLRTNVVKDVPLSVAEGLNFRLGETEGSKFSIAANTLKVEKPEGTTVASDTLFATLGKYNKTLLINAVPQILPGDGTEESPYLIASSGDWNKLADFMTDSKWEYSGNHFKITNDIDFAGDSIRLLGVDGVNFQANLEGANHSIKNYVYNNPNSVKTKLVGPNLYVGKYIGLIGTLGNSGRVANLTIDGKFECHSYAAAMVGENYGIVEGITHKGTVKDITSGYVSGMVCRSYDGSVIRNCTQEGTVTSTKTYAAGFVYQAKLGSQLENLQNKGTVSVGTSYAYGIANQIDCSAKNCSNVGKLEGNSSIYGICGTLGLNASLEDCYNTSDIYAKTGGNVAGLFATATARKSTTEPVGGFVKGCYNTGALSANGYVFGLASAVNAGWTMEDCYNTGDLSVRPANATASAPAAGLVNTFKGAAASSTDPNPVLSQMVRCYNTGNVTGQYGGVSGLMIEAAKLTYIADCYNLGNVKNTLATALTTAGLIGKHNGLMERCFNAGNVESAGNAVGGLVGYISGGDASYVCKMLNCFNIGNVTSTYTGTSGNGNAGGLGGYLTTYIDDDPHVIENCYNTGNVTSTMRVGGLFGGAFRPYSIVRNCYCSGKVLATELNSSDQWLWSGTTYTNNYTFAVNGEAVFMLANHENCYYDKTVSPGSQFRNVPNSGKTTDDLRKIVISDAYVTPEHGGFPILKDFAELDASHAGSALILLSGDDTTHDLVKNNITLVGPEGCVWTAEDVNENGTRAASSSVLLEINGNTATPVGKGDVVLTCTYKGHSKSYALTVEGVPSVVDESFAAKEVKTVEYINLQGHRVQTPEEGQVYVVRTVFQDGTIRVEKKIAK